MSDAKLTTAPNTVQLDENGVPIYGDGTPAIMSADDLLKYKLVKTSSGMKWMPLDEAPGARNYNRALGEVIASAVAEGRPLKEVLQSCGVTMLQYGRWRKLYEDFREAVDEARRINAEVLYDKIVTTVESVDAIEEDIAKARLQVDAYKHVASVSDPGRFGSKTQIDAKIGIGQIVLDTGIRRPGDPGYEERVVDPIRVQQEELHAREMELSNTTTAKKPEGLMASEREKDGLA